MYLALEMQLVQGNEHRYFIPSQRYVDVADTDKARGLQ